MSAEAEENSNQSGGNGQGFTPPATQEELNRIIAERLARERAKFADYEDLKSNAKNVDEITAQFEKSLLEVTTEKERLAAEIAELKQAQQLQSWVNEVASEFGVPADVLRGSTKEELAAHAETLKSALQEFRHQRPTPDVSKTPPALNSSALEEALRRAVGA